MLRLLILVLVLLEGLSVIFTASAGTVEKKCEPMDCQGKVKECPYGYRKVDGCEICQCYNPCHPLRTNPVCGANKRCSVDRSVNGTFVARCESVRTLRSKANCEQPKVVGPCRGAIPRFYYHSATRKCKRFLYGGCGGNENNFKTEDECTKTCVH